jgi:predicted NAD-dependent protein-ADP-ribosyltransferase YbiA (DUF1768 family)
MANGEPLVQLIGQGIKARKQRESVFFNLAERFRAARDPQEVKALGEQLGRFIFGE